MAKGLSAAKAKKILEDGKVRGKALTEKQKKFFGTVAGGATPLKKLNGGWLDKFDNVKKAQDGEVMYDTVMYGTPEYEAAYREGRFADVPNPLDEVVIYSGVDYEKYPYYNDLNAQQKEYFNDPGSIGRGVRRAASTKRGLAEDTYDVVNPIMYGALGLAGAMMAGPSIIRLGRSVAPYVSRYALNPIQKVLNYKPLGGPVSVGNVLDAGSAAYAAYATPEAYDKFKENPSFDTGTDLALTAIDLVPFGEIFTGFKGTRNLYNKGKNLFTNDLTPNPNMYHRGIGQAGLDAIDTPSSSFVEAAADPGVRQTLKNLNDELGIVNTVSAQIRASEKFNKNWFNNPETIRRVEEMINQPTSLRSNMSEIEILQDINLYETMLDKSPNLTAAQKAGIERQMKDLYAGLAKKNLQTVQQKGRFTEVFDPDNIRHQDIGLTYEENPNYLGFYKGRTNQGTVNVSRVKEKAMDVGSVFTHEDLHAITAGRKGYTDEATQILNDAVGKDQDWWLNKINTQKDPKVREELIDQLEYLSRPQEIHARVHELRKAFNLKPGQEVSAAKIDQIMMKGLKGETPVSEDFFRMLGDKENFRKIFNKLPAFVPAAVGLGAASQNKNGGWLDKFQEGGEIDEAQWGALLKLAKKYGSKAVDYLKVLRSEGKKVANTANTTGKLKYLDELSYDAKKDIRELNYKVQSKTDKETRKLGKPHTAQEEYGEGWKYSDEVDFNNPEEVAAHRKRWIDSQKKGNFLYQNRSFPLFDETSDIFSDLTRYDLSNAVRSSLDKPLGTIGNSYRTSAGQVGLSYDFSYPSYSSLNRQSVETAKEYKTMEDALEVLDKKARENLGMFYNTMFEKPSRIDYGDLLKYQNRNGGVIEDDRGQWAYPGEITKINSNNITMKGVNYPVLGISDTGDKKMMQPGKDYKFKGNSVTEFPMAKDGKSLVELNQLTNFTNYNTPQPGGWLDKYH